MADWMNKPMPPGWEQKFDPRVNRYYYVNHATSERVKNKSLSKSYNLKILIFLNFWFVE